MNDCMMVNINLNTLTMLLLPSIRGHSTEIDDGDIDSEGQLRRSGGERRRESWPTITFVMGRG